MVCTYIHILFTVYAKYLFNFRYKCTTIYGKYDRWWEFAAFINMELTITAVGNNDDENANAWSFSEKTVIVGLTR